MKQEKVIRISVRELVEFILRGGDIDNRRTAAPDQETMQMGSRIHRKIQRQMGSAYRAEISLKIQVPCEGFVLQIEGRADGIFEEDEKTFIDEIKGVMRDLDRIEEPVGVHLAQAKCYAYIYAKMSDLKMISVQMTYCQMETEAIKRFRQELLFAELEKWFLEVVREYEKWARFQVEWKEHRNHSIKKIQFPYEYRVGQKELVTSVYKTILRKKKLFIQAPTGVGKTMATVFPAVKAVGEELGDKIFYLTAKTITRTVAEQAFQILKEKGLEMKVVTLTAKEKICFCEQAECNPDDCSYAKGHFDRVNDAVFDMITTTNDMCRENVEKYAKKHQVCPFEMSLDVSLWVDAVICDYNYVFDPNAHLKRFFAEGRKQNYLFLVDEAHNLVERGREMYSATLYKEEFLRMKKNVKVEHSKLARYLDACNKILLEYKRECENYELHQNLSPFIIKLMNVLTEMEKILEEDKQKDEAFLEFYFHVRSFLKVYDELDENYEIYTEMEVSGAFKLKLFCVNPAANLEKFLCQGNSTIFFSATMLPINYYKKLLSVEADDYAVYAESPFDVKKRLLMIGNDVSTRYTMRGKGMYAKYAEYIRKIVNGKEGNYLAFFPSYQFMEAVLIAFESSHGKKMDHIVQDQNMNEEKREAFLKQFKENREGNLVGFCVLGGVFSEGIDLTEESLIGAIIVGTGLPQVCNEREILRQYFERHNSNGFDFAYLYPGMNKVLQAAGRVIRTENDRGVIALLDERFLNRHYRETFPREWKDGKNCNIGQIEEQMKEFWKTITLKDDHI